jgi:hypothetical protein
METSPVNGSSGRLFSLPVTSALRFSHPAHPATASLFFL